jgi:acetyltransferase-like isoleucine patch superfamily enzyme
MSSFLKKILLKTGLIQRLGNYLIQYQREKQREEMLGLLKRDAVIDETCIIQREVIISNHAADRTKIRVGAYSMIDGALFSVLKYGGEIQVGKHCFIGPGTRIWSAKKISIGDRVLISHNVNIHDNISHPLDSKQRHEDYEYVWKHGHQAKVDYREKEIIIEDDVWIGFNAIIMKGVRIGKGSVIGAGTIITKDIPEFSIVVGNPARIISQTT